MTLMSALRRQLYPKKRKGKTKLLQQWSLVKAKQLFMRFPWAMAEAEEANSKQRSWQGHAPPPVFYLYPARVNNNYSYPNSTQ